MHPLAVTRAPETLRRRERKNFAFIQAEDELAAIGMVIGAGWNGARSFTSTSGPGISLMNELIGLAYYAEIPAVIHRVFSELAFGPFTIYLNNRKLLRGLLQAFEIGDALQDGVLHEIDRLGKQARPEIEARLAGEGFALDPARITQLFDLLTGCAGDSRAAFAADRKSVV